MAVQDELTATEFFGFSPDELYNEVYAIGYNEFLAAVASLRETLLQEFPERAEEVKKGCSELLASYSKQFDQEWYTKFLQYCTKNIFTIPRHVPIYGDDLGREENEGACSRLEELRHRIMTTEYLNSKLQARIHEMDREVERRKAVIQQIKETESRVGLLKRARELEGQLRDTSAKLWQ